MKRNSVLLLIFLTACLQQEKKEANQLDYEVQELQRLAMWQREYYFEAVKWSKKNPDSAAFFERKMDSVTRLYGMQMKRYDSLSKIYNKK